MIALDEDALICDFAETYHIYDMYALPVEYVATLAKGLKIDSRIKTVINGLRVDLNHLLLAHIADNTAINAWLQSEEARKGTNRPKSLVYALNHEKPENSEEIEEAMTFDNGDDFNTKWERINNE